MDILTILPRSRGSQYPISTVLWRQSVLVTLLLIPEGVTVPDMSCTFNYGPKDGSQGCLNSISWLRWMENHATCVKLFDSNLISDPQIREGGWGQQQKVATPQGARVGRVPVAVLVVVIEEAQGTHSLWGLVNYFLTIHATSNHKI